MSQVTEEPVRAVLDKLQHLSADAEARRLAFVRERALRDERTLIKEARELGLTQGIERGQAVARRETALNLIHQTDLDDAVIAAATGLPAEVIARLRTGQG